jgi:hypothetical protein
VTPSRKKIVEKAEVATSESKHVDFKARFDPSSTEAWCGIIKDIVAMANSGGGILVFGVENDGKSSNIDPKPILAYDSANITNKVERYTGYQFSEIEIVEVTRSSKSHAAFLISPTEIPIVFTKPGEIETSDKKKKIEFAKGTIYFRHGSKSEPGNHEDLARWHRMEIEKARRSWMTGIRKVVETSPGEAVTVIPSSLGSPGLGQIVKAAMTDDPTAVKFAPTNAEEIWPHRQVDLVREVNKRLPSGVKIGPFDVQCIKAKYDIFRNHPEFAYRPHKKASPQYSEAFVNWLIEQYEQNKNFFSKAREEHKTK